MKSVEQFALLSVVTLTLLSGIAHAGKDSGGGRRYPLPRETEEAPKAIAVPEVADFGALPIEKNEYGKSWADGLLVLSISKVTQRGFRFRISLTKHGRYDGDGTFHPDDDQFYKEPWVKPGTLQGRAKFLDSEHKAVAFATIGENCTLMFSSDRRISRSVQVSASLGCQLGQRGSQDREISEDHLVGIYVGSSDEVRRVGGHPH